MSRRIVSLLGALLVAAAVAGGAAGSYEPADTVPVAGDGHWCC